MRAKYQIRYNHQSCQYADSKRAALRTVRQSGRVRKLAVASVPDGDYCYLSREAKDRDDTGTRAFAVICGPTQQPE